MNVNLRNLENHRFNNHWVIDMDIILCCMENWSGVKEKLVDSPECSLRNGEIVRAGEARS